MRNNYESIMNRLSDFDDREVAFERNLETMNGEVVHALIADKIGHVFRRNC